MRRQGVVPMVLVLVVAVASLTFTLAKGWAPLLGLDLQGGVSVVLQPKEEVGGEALDQAIEIIRSRVDALGVAEPEITRQGDTILVQIPGVEDRERALELVGQTAELRFRPVLSAVPAGTPIPAPTTSTTAPADPAAGPDTTAVPTDTTAPATTAASLLPPDVCTQGVPDDQDLPDQAVTLPQCDGDQLVYVFQLGPTLLTGESLQTASATLEQGTWGVRPVFREGADGIDRFNAAASQCYSGATACPAQPGGRGQLAIVLDGEVVSAPSINAATFARDDIVISGSFDESSANDLATVLRYGALPVELERQQEQIVSATLGQDALDAGIRAGIVGFVLVVAFMVGVYRLLGVLAIAKLAVEGAILWSIISWLGETQGLALTLAGVTGLIVSIGVSVDSNVVYYEHIKEELHKGRTLRTASASAFGTSFRTIFAADFASLLGAVLLWWLTVGAVRGFALNLALATILDLIVAWCFMRPAVSIALRSDLAARHPRWFGLPAERTEPGPDAPRSRQPVGVGS